MSIEPLLSSGNRVKLGVSLAVILTLFLTPTLTVLAATSQPVITIMGVTFQSYVQIRIDNLPANTEFTVTMSDGSAKGYGPTIAHINSGNGGQAYYKFPILASVRTDTQLAIRIQSSDGVAAYATFDNTHTYPLPLKTQGIVVPIPTPNPSLTATPAPIVLLAPTQPVAQRSPSVIRVLHVQQNGYVMVTINNMPLNTNFQVWMGAKGTQGLGGTHVADLPTGLLSTHISVFEIPGSLTSNQYIDLRVASSGYVYVTTFTNTTY